MDADGVDTFENNSTMTIDEVTVANLSTGTHITNLILSILTITINAVVVGCLITHRRLFPQVLWCQTASLCVSDIIAGLSPGFLCLTTIQSVNQNTKACSALIIFFHCAQLTCVFNVWQMSVRRILVIKRLSQFQKPISPWRVALMPVLMWCFSFLCFCPVIVLFTRNPTVPGCSSPLIFRDNYLPVAIIYEIALQVFAVATLTVFYAYAIYVVTKNFRSRIMPMEHTGDLKNLRNRSDTSPVSNTPNVQVRNGASVHVQKRAFKQLCAVVLVTNLTTWPYVLISLCVATDVLPYQFNNVEFLDMHMLCLNSLLNPFMYGLAVKEVRVALKENIRNLSPRNAAVN